MNRYRQIAAIVIGCVAMAGIVGGFHGIGGGTTPSPAPPGLPGPHR